MFTFINLHPLRRPFSKKKGWPHLSCRVDKASDFTDSSATEVGAMLLLLLLCHRTRLGSQCQVSGQHQQQQRVSAIAHTQQQQLQSGFLSVGLSFPLGSRSYQISSQRDLDPARFSLKISGTLKYYIHNPADLVTIRRVGLSSSK